MHRSDHIIKPGQDFISSQNGNYETRIRRRRACGQRCAEQLTSLPKADLLGVGRISAARPLAPPNPCWKRRPDATQLR